MRLGNGAAVACVIVAAALWGATFVMIRDSVRSVAPVTLVFTRFALAAVPLVNVSTCTPSFPVTSSVTELVTAELRN